MAMKLERSWKFLSGLTLSVLLQSCAFTPGMQVDAGPQGFFRGTPTEPEEEDGYVLIPVNDKLVARMEVDAKPKDREIPTEWKLDDKDYEYRIGPNDLLQVIVWDHPELSLTGAGADAAASSPPGAGAGTNASSANTASTLGIRVNRRGDVFFPFIGWVHVAGRTIEETQELLRNGLARYIQDPQVDARIVGFRSQRVRVAGEVRNPTIVPITDVPLRLLDAITAAGGAAPASGSLAGGGNTAAILKPDLEEVHVLRNGREVIVSLLDILDKHQGEDNILLQDGDLIQVPNLDAKKIYVMGEVRSQGLQAFERGQLTLAAAIQKSGGISQDSAEGTRTLVMRRGNKKPLIFYFNMNDPETVILATRFPLKPLDVVYVATSDISKFQRVVQAFQPIINYGMWGIAYGAAR